MVGVVSVISSAQNAALKSGFQGMSAPVPAPPPSISSIDFITSGIHVDNLQNVAILEYRSSKTGDVVRQYPDQAQINAFKAAERLAQLAEEAHRQQATQQAAQQQSPSTETGGQPAGASSSAQSAPAFPQAATAVANHMPQPSSAHAAVPVPAATGGTAGGSSATSTVSIMA